MTHYVYIEGETLDTGERMHTVGFFDPAGQWHPESDHADKGSAADRVAFLNGVTSSAELALMSDRIAEIAGKVESAERVLDDTRAQLVGILKTVGMHAAQLDNLAAGEGRSPEPQAARWPSNRQLVDIGIDPDGALFGLDNYGLVYRYYGADEGGHGWRRIPYQKPVNAIDDEA